MNEAIYQISKTQPSSTPGPGLCGKNKNTRPICTGDCGSSHVASAPARTKVRQCIVMSTHVDCKPQSCGPYCTGAGYTALLGPYSHTDRTQNKRLSKKVVDHEYVVTALLILIPTRCQTRSTGAGKALAPAHVALHPPTPTHLDFASGGKSGEW
ncbi:hypothetical protein J6590_032833 [Homalodisca vitripennis]|nr:hypothetical protein J6590_032833 [Homalodisca vitripennis]